VVYKVCVWSFSAWYSILQSFSVLFRAKLHLLYLKISTNVDGDFSSVQSLRRQRPGKGMYGRLMPSVFAQSLIYAHTDPLIACFVKRTMYTSDFVIKAD